MAASWPVRLWAAASTSSGRPQPGHEAYPRAANSALLHDDAGLRPGDSSGRLVGRPDPLGAGGPENESLIQGVAEDVYALVGRREAVVGRNGRLGVRAREVDRAEVAGRRRPMDRRTDQSSSIMASSF